MEMDYNTWVLVVWFGHFGSGTPVASVGLMHVKLGGLVAGATGTIIFPIFNLDPAGHSPPLFFILQSTQLSTHWWHRLVVVFIGILNEIEKGG